MSEMSNRSSENNGVNRAGPVGEGSSPGRCYLVRQRGPSCHPTTVRTKWSKNVSKIVMECFFRSKPFDDDGKPIRGYKQRMMQEWKEHGPEKEIKKIEKYQYLKRELKRLWSLEKVEVVPVAVGALRVH